MTSVDVAAALLALALLLVTGYLAAIETVVTRLNVVRALRLREEQAPGAAPLLWLTEHKATSLNVVLVLTVTARITLAALVTVVGGRLLGGAAGIVTAVLAAVVLTLLVGEVVPRTVALRNLETVGCRLAGLTAPLVRLLEPLARVVVAASRVLVPRRHEVSGPYAPDDELRNVEGEDDDQDDKIEPGERAMIRSIFGLADTIAREIMVPRPDMVTVPEDASLDEVVELAVSHGYSRIPVRDPEDADVIVGVVYAKDLLRRIADGSQRWVDLIREPTFVPETKRCGELLRELQAAAVHLSIVVDEHGEIVGLVTIEDILEEIVGEIVDEHDREEPLVEVLDEARLRIDARLGVDDLNELLDTDLPEQGWDTVGGLVFGTLGRVPVEGETIELDGLSITVERVQGRRVGKLVVERRQESAAPAESGEKDA